MAGISKGSVDSGATAEWFHHKITRGCHLDAIEEKWIQFPTGLNRFLLPSVSDTVGTTGFGAITYKVYLLIQA